MAGQQAPGSPPSGGGTRRHYLELDGLRGVAALSVMVMHVGAWFLPGGALPHAYMAVDFFFLLSGFVIAYAYEDKLLGVMGFWRFLWIRFVRLYPLIVLGGVVAGAFLVLRLASHSDISPGALTRAVLGGVTLIPTFSPSPVAKGVFPLNGPLWSLFYELAVNILYAATVRWWTVRRLAVVVGLSALVLAWASFRFNGLDLGLLPQDFWGGAPRIGFGFFAGILIFRLLREGRLKLPGLGPFLLSLVLLLVFCAPKIAGFGGIYDLVCVLAVFPLVLLVGAAREPVGFAAGFCRLSGALSYPIYVLHRPVIWWLNGVYNSLALTSRTPPPIPGLIALAAVVACSWLALKLYDEPVRRRLGALGGRPSPIRPAATGGG